MSPLTPKGKKILRQMRKPVSEGGYGDDRGKAIFYASINKGRIKGAHEAGKGGGYMPRKRK